MIGLDDLELFRNIVDCGGLSAAARRLGIAKSTLSRRMAALEDRLGQPLYHRNTRRFRLTNFGAEIHRHCVGMATEAEKVFALAERMRQQPAGMLHVICPPVIGSAVVDALAVEFAASAPGVRLHLEETIGVFDPRTTLADFIIYPSAGPLPDSALIARRIMSSPHLLAAHPDVLLGRPEPLEPSDLAGFPCMGRGDRGTDWHWTLHRKTRVERIDFDPVFTATLPSAMLQAARHGLGIASLPEAICQDDMRSGRLVRILPDWQPEPMHMYAIFPNSKELTAAARHFLDLLIERLPRFIQKDGQD